MKCLICNHESPNARGLGNHIKKAHNISTQDYYNKFFKQPNENKCIVCGKPTKYINITLGYRNVCSVSCGQKNPETRNKIESTNIKKYGKSTPLITKESLKKSHNKRAMNKKHKNMIKKYGYANSFCTMETQRKCQQTMIQRYGSSNPIVCNISIFNKYNGTRSSYEQLLKKYLDKNKIIYKYEYNKDNRYPYYCDFYLPKNDIFVEINGYWMHGGHYFNKRKKSDKEKLDDWINKAKKSARIKTAIEVWTQKDVEKRKCAKKNKLNYVVLWSKQDILNWVNSNFEIRHDY